MVSTMHAGCLFHDDLDQQLHASRDLANMMIQHSRRGGRLGLAMSWRDEGGDEYARWGDEFIAVVASFSALKVFNVVQVV